MSSPDEVIRHAIAAFEAQALTDEYISLADRIYRGLMEEGYCITDSEAYADLRRSARLLAEENQKLIRRIRELDDRIEHATCALAGEFF